MNYIEADHHPLLYELSNQADWAREDSFPARPEWADEVEAWLRFVDTRRELARFLPRLKENAYQRDRTLAELGVGYFLEVRCSLPIIEWKPFGEAGKRGEFLVSSECQTLFVEVKTGGWQKDIADAEGRESHRLNEPKYIQAAEKKRGQATFPLHSPLPGSYAQPPMPRIPRGHSADHAYHILNRGNVSATVFHADGDDRVFLGGSPAKTRKSSLSLYIFLVIMLAGLLNRGEHPHAF